MDVPILGRPLPCFWLQSFSGIAMQENNRLFPHCALSAFHPLLSELPWQQLSQQYFWARDRNTQIPLSN